MRLPTGEYEALKEAGEKPRAIGFRRVEAGHPGVGPRAGGAGIVTAAPSPARPEYRSLARSLAALLASAYRSLPAEPSPVRYIRRPRQWQPVQEGRR